MSITAADVRAWIGDFAGVVAEHRQELVRLDTAIGDGDHGTNMDRGMKAAVEKLEATEGDDIGALLKAVGMALVSKVGGAAGPLYGTLFLQMGTAAAGKTELDLAGWTAALEAGVQGVQARGKAEPRDKTMLDALLPGGRGAARRASDARRRLRASADAAPGGHGGDDADGGAQGPASYLGPRSVGHQDPGATSSHLLLSAARGRARRQAA